MLWLAIALMTIAALGLLALPFLGRRATLASREAYDLAVYRDQLRELEQDLARGVVSASEADAARLEIQRRMLRVAPAGAGAATSPAHAASPPARQSHRWFRYLSMGALGLAVPAIALGLYASLGSPHLPSKPFSEAQREALKLQDQTIEAAITGLKERLAKQPRDTEGWLLLGRSYIFLQRFTDAVTALKQAAAIQGGKPEINSMLAEAMVFEAQGQVTPDARSLFESVREKDSKNTAALYYLGMAEAQSGKPKEALATWEELAAITPGDAPWRDDLVNVMKQAAAELGVEPKILPPLPSAPPATAEAEKPAPGPSEEDIKAAADMSPEEQQAMIRSMVERLAGKLKENPDDLAGWQRLANAYRVLGEEVKAKEAEAEIARLQAKGASGATGSSSTAPAPGPTEDDVKAAAEMSPEDRQAMIRSMVERLAGKLKENPDDLAGWQRLANAYRVLGEEAKAKEAEAQIARLQARSGSGAANSSSAARESGPSEEEMKAAAELPPEDQTAMIRTMVEGLAKRLESSPDDLEGWKRLGLSYRVLGEMEKALHAFERAAALAPKDAAVQADYARALLDAAPAGEPIPPASIEKYRQVLTLDPNNMDALWFVGYAEATAATPNKDAARGHWQKLLGLLKPGTDSYISVENALKALEQPS